MRRNSRGRRYCFFQAEDGIRAGRVTRVQTCALPICLESLVDSYPLYSRVDEALFELGQLFEKEADAMKKQPRIAEAEKEKVAADFQKHAVEAYSKRSEERRVGKECRPGWSPRHHGSK